MISTICMNPCFDETVDVDTLQVGQVNQIRNARIDLGGKGINVAVVAGRLGLEVQCIGMMGGALFQRLAFVQANADTAFCDLIRRLTTGKPGPYDGGFIHCLHHRQVQLPYICMTRLRKGESFRPCCSFFRPYSCRTSGTFQ